MNAVAFDVSNNAYSAATRFADTMEWDYSSVNSSRNEHAALPAAILVLRGPIVDLETEAFRQNPFPTLALLRERGQLIRTRVPLFGQVWMATTYDAVDELLRDHHRFVQNPSSNRWMGLLVRMLPGNLKPIASNMLLRDPPDHRRLRSLVDQAFLRQSIEHMQPRIEALAEETLDRFAEQAAASANGVDLVAHFARPFPLAVICELLGLPPEDRPKFTQWASRLLTSTSIFGIAKGLFGVSNLMSYARAEFHRQRKKPRNGLFSALIAAEEAGDKLSEDELIAMVFLLLAAGHETTLHQITGSVLALFDHPEQRAELTSNWGLADSAADELLRFVSFAVVAKPRYAKADLVFHGQQIRRGEMLLACLASANADPAVFDEPETLKLKRSPNRHLAFGTGIHVCLGAKLARVEIAIALRRLFTRFPGLRLAVPRSEIRYVPRFGSRALTALPVEF